MSHVAANIRRAREERGHTQESLGRALNISARTVCFWEQGSTRPNRKNLEALAKQLKREPEWFYLNREDEPVAA